MVTCMTELFMWTLKNQSIALDDVIGLHTYHDKTQAVSGEPLYLDEKRQYSEGQDISWTPRNKRPEKLRESLKEIEDLLCQHRVVQVRWRSRRILQTVLSNLIVVTYVIAGHSGDVEKIFIDKSLMNKNTTDLVSDAYLCEQFVIITYLDRNKIDFVHFTKRPALGDTLKRLEKMTLWEPKVTQLEIPGPIGRRLERKVSVNTRQDMVLIWWTTSSEEAMPWSPMVTDKERANMVILSAHGPNIDLLNFTRSECDPLHACFSTLQPHRCFTVERTVGAGSETSSQTCTYEVIRGKIQRINTTSVPLKGAIVCQARNGNEDKLILGCADGSVVLLDDYRKKTSVVRSYVIIADIAWHPSDTIFFVMSSHGDVQVFDLALTPLRIQLVAEEPHSQRVLQLGKYFSFGLNLRELKWCPFDPQSAEWTGDYSDAMFLHLDRGPPALMLLHLGVVSRERFSCLELIKEYIKLNHTEEAVTLLENMNWDTHGSACYSCLSTLVNHLLRKPLNAERECQLEAALGTFYSPKRAISEAVIMDYRDPISRLARRFFHHLLRYSRFDKAFLLAVDIGAQDLFMDIYYMALDKGETALAEVAKKKADLIERESLDPVDGFEDGVMMNDFDIIDHYSSRTTNQNQHYSVDVPGSLQDYGLRQDYAHTDHHQNPSVENDLHISHRSVNTHTGGIDVEADLIQDYTQALHLDQPSWIHSSSSRHRQQEKEDEESSDPENVIHFGVV